jgi:hypothetical protein
MVLDIVNLCGDNFYLRRDRSVSIATGYELDDRASTPCRARRFLFTPQRPDRLWGPLGSHAVAAGGTLFSGGKAGYSAPSSVETKNGEAVPPIQLHLVSRHRMVKLYLHSPIRFHCGVLN